jgi:GNAT superfamily N-acetyltransferase
MSDRIYPDAPATAFTEPPVEFEDREGRTVEIRPYDGEEEESEALVEMYLDFDPSDRAQGIPPGRESRIRSWLENILAGDCLNVIAWDGANAAGHATLVPAEDDAYELAIFVLQEYQQAGIGTRLIEALLGYGRANDVGKVWLTVERWNRAAVSLYKKIGFETSDAESFELEMTLRLS